MISLIKGKIISKTLSEIVVLTSGGVGYKIFVVPSKVENYPIGVEMEILTHLVVKEDALDLYGFSNLAEKEMFTMALSVSGIGPKSALQLLSLGSVSEIKTAIASGDADYLSKIHGVGRKTAERLILELKNKIGTIDFVATIGRNAANNNVGEVIAALITMGYKEQVARETVKNIDATEKTSEELLKEVLKQIR